MPSLSSTTSFPAISERLKALVVQFNTSLLPKLKQQRVALVIGFAILAAVLATVAMWQSDTELTPLFGRQERYDAASIMEVLDSSHIPYSLHPDSGQILVDHNLIAKARMTLAANGIAPDVPAGMELLSTAGELGRSQFVERARYKQAMEGELAKTIISLRAVRNARIHLALPERSSFVREVPKPTASVFLDLYPGARLKQPQIQAIVNLVSGSIPDLSPDNVNVLDQNGNMLSTSLVDGVPDWQLEHTIKQEQAVAQRVTALLEPVVGSGNLRVQVTADIDYSSHEVTREQFNPDSQAVRSENISSDDQTTAVAKGVPGVESNRTTNSNGKESVARSSSHTQRSYELDKTISRDTKAPGSVQKLSIGIVVNSLAAEGDSGWSPESLETMNRLVSNAVGLEPERGDIISLYSLPFSQQAIEEEPQPWYALFEGESGPYMLTGLGAMILLILGLILRMHFYRKQVHQQRDQAMKIKTLRERESKEAAEAGLTIEGHPDDQLIEQARQLVMNRPEQVALMLEQWIDE